MSPLRAFTRKVRQPCEIGGVAVPNRSRILVLYASANRDEHEWTDPDVFDIRRNGTRHLGFGHGAYNVRRSGLARLEMEAMLKALIKRVRRIELSGKQTWALNNIIRCHEHLPLPLFAD